MIYYEKILDKSLIFSIMEGLISGLYRIKIVLRDALMV